MVNEDGVVNVASQDIASELAVVAGTVTYVRDIVIAIGQGIGVRVFFETRSHTGVNVPIGGVHSDVSYFVIVLAKQGG